MATKSECVEVVVRVKPFDNKETKENGKLIIKVNGNELCIESVDCGRRKEFTRKYVFDHVFGLECNQIDIYKICAFPVIKSVLNGYNGTIFVYGQIGTGKTYTIEGDINNNINKGIIPRTFVQIMDYINNSNDNIKFVVQISYLEIYKDEVYDLITKNKRQKLIVKEGKNGFYVKNLSIHTVKSINGMMKLFKKGQKMRAIGSTSINHNNSSRSHSVLSIIVESSWKDNNNSNNRIMGKLRLVDLAGFDRGKKIIQNIGDKSDESKYINSSLSALGNVINALSNNKTTYIPYRDSKLTRLLSDSLGGHTKTVMIANISSCSNNLEETISTLRYANYTKNIKNKPQINKHQKREKISNKIIKKQQQLKLKKDSAIKDEEKHDITGSESEKELKIENESQLKREKMSINLIKKNDELELNKQSLMNDEVQKASIITNKKEVVMVNMNDGLEQTPYGETYGSEWQCKICTVINESKENIFCTVCGWQNIDNKMIGNEAKLTLERKSSIEDAQKRYVSAAEDEKDVITLKMDKSNESDKLWRCPMCTFDNKLKSPLCAMCGATKVKEIKLESKSSIKYTQKQTYDYIIQEMIKLINRNNNKFELLKTVTHITGLSDIHYGDNVWDNMNTGKLEMRLQLDYDEWMRDKKKYEIKFVNEVSEILGFESRQIIIANYRRGSVRLAVIMKLIDISVWWNGYSDDVDGRQKDYLCKEMRVQDQIYVEYKNKWYVATISKIYIDGNIKKFQVRYNPERNKKGKDPFLWNTEWFHGCKQGARWKFNGQTFKTLKNQQGETFNEAWIAPALTTKKAWQHIRSDDHIFVGRNRCIVMDIHCCYGVGISDTIVVKILNSGKTMELRKRANFHEISFKDMRDT